MTVCHALFSGKTYNTFAYDLFGTLKYLGFKDQLIMVIWEYKTVSYVADELTLNSYGKLNLK